MPPDWLTGADAGRKKVRSSVKDETRVAALVGGKRFPGSGNRRQRWSRVTPRADIAAPGLHIEHKRTERASISLTLEWLAKLKSGLPVGKTPVLVVTFAQSGQDWAVLPLTDLLALRARIEQ